MSDKKKVLILTADAGFGHRSAAKAIAAALDEKYGQECQVDIVNPLDDKRTPIFLRRIQNDYDRIVRDWPELYKLGYQANDTAITSTLLERALTVLLYEVMRSLVRQYRPDIIVSTYPFYQAPLSAYFTIKNYAVPLVTVVTDLVTVHRLWFHPSSDLCLVPTPEAAQLALKNGLEPATVKLTGIPVHPKFARVQGKPEELRASLGWQPDLTTVLAIGSKRVERLPEFLRPLNHSGFPIQLAVVAGGDDDLYRQFERTEWHVPTHVYNFVDNMPALMHAANCVVCKAGGLTVTESLACGLPILLIEVIPGQETGNAEYVLEGRAGDLAPQPLALLETLCHWLLNDAELLKERTRNAHRIGRPDAAYKIADLVWGAIQPDPYHQPRRFPLSLSIVTDLLGRYGIPWDEKRTEAGGE